MRQHDWTLTFITALLVIGCALLALAYNGSVQ
jgi:hypothetical protein